MDCSNKHSPEAYLFDFLNRDKVNMMHPSELLERQREEEDLIELADSLDFNINSSTDRKKLNKIQRHLDAGKEFGLVKLLTSRTGNRRQVRIGFFDYFPSYSDAIEMCEEEHGGGVYGVIAHPDSHILKRYRLEGESKTPENISNGQKQSATTVKAQLESVVSERLSHLLADNPQLADRAALGLLEKTLRVNLSGNQTDPVEAVIDALEKGERIRDALGSNGGWADVLRDVVKSVIPAVPQVRQMIEAGNQAQKHNQTHIHDQQPNRQPSIVAPADGRIQVHPVSGQIPVEKNNTNEGRVMGIQQEPVERSNEVEEGGQIDWASILLHTDWTDLEQRIHGTPASFVEWAVSEYNSGNQGASVLLSLFADNEPQETVGAITIGFDNLSSQGWVHSLIKAVGKGGDLEAGERIVRYFNTNDGLQWVTQVHNLLVAMESGDQGQAVAPVAASEPNREEFLEDLRQSVGGNEPVVSVPSHFSKNGHRDEEDSEGVF